ncbi:hypothetical protein QTL86_10145 [Cellulosilyticum sp. ST5]|uniref:Uncharacterized protein n=1 Tax=Cellulosilyticum lentocellum (strain ATCC 49066 / DSM 5427 / NCIMB 11756 / RHM5) TaxID=642492 RepID=F2JJ27_CELLD|nr:MULTISPECIES: hypothetical protein [Cellulosilyticum]ADZ83186.1 hypothetical protein Clole_1460 [Cellulosilyticum lentocellum DSM 5427]
MINFEKELEKFRPILNVNRIEERISQEDMMDMIDIFKFFDNDIYNEASALREMKDGE